MRGALLQLRGWLQDEAWAIRQGVKTWRTARGYIAFCQQEAEDHYAQEDAEAHCPADDERIGTNRELASTLSCDDGHGCPPTGADMCPRGCQPLFGLGECGMCGYEGDGVWDDETTEVVDACEETGHYTRQTSDGYCYGCGKHH